MVVIGLKSIVISAFVTPDIFCFVFVSLAYHHKPHPHLILFFVSPDMSSPVLSSYLTDTVYRCLPSSPQSIVHPSASITISPQDMKDVSTLSTKPSRASVYPKKRPSPHGVVKGHKSPLLPAYGPLRRSPRSAKSQQKQYEAQILALRRQGVLLEEEYREEIRQYMHDMEVRLLIPFASSLLT
jgi:hypothetical protein